MSTIERDFTNQEVVDRDMYRDYGHEFFTWARANHPVYLDPAGTWGITKHADLRWCERQPKIFSNAKGSRPNSVQPQPSMIDSDDPWHAVQRRLVSHGFTNRQMRAYEEHIKTTVRQLVDTVLVAGRMDLVDDLAKPLPMTLIGEMLGAGVFHYDALQHWSDVMISGTDKAEYKHPGIQQAIVDYYNYIVPVMEDRKANPTDDLISQLIHGDADGEGLDDAHIIGNALLLLVGGNETARNVMAGGLHALITNPDQLEIARASIAAEGYVADTVVEECLRWVSPIVNMARWTTEDVEVRGVTIPKDSQVLMIYMSANRDEEVFENPFDFDVTRDPNPHVAFGFGPHLCLGSALARLELRWVLTEVLSRCRNLRLEDPDFQPEYSHSSFVRGVQRVPVVFDAA